MSLNSISKFMFLALFGAMLSSCEKVIDVDLNSSDPKTVIEANLREGTHPFEVRVYQTKDYFSGAATVWFDDAVVSLSDDTGESYLLASTGAGRYTAEITAVAGRHYTLEVLRHGETFTAMSLLPQRIAIEKLGTKEISLPGEENSQEVYLKFQDPPDVRNFYRIIVSVNDSLEQDLQYFDDKYTDGNIVEWALINFYEKGDHLSVEMRSIDQAAYNYYYTLAPILSGNTNTAPGNPTTNWTGGALGYFIAYNPSQIEGIVE